MILDIEIMGIKEKEYAIVRGNVASELHFVKYQMRKLIQDTMIDENGHVCAYYDGSIMNYCKPQWTEWEDIPIKGEL